MNLYLFTFSDKCSTDLQADGAAEDEIDDEMSLMRAQRGYCMQMMDGCAGGKNADKIVEIYTNVLKSKYVDVSIFIYFIFSFSRSSDAIVNACVQNNLVATRTDLTVFEARKRLKSCHSAAVQAKLTQKQKRIFAINDALLLLGNQQVCGLF